jgi:hypothetical protein
LLTGSLSTLKFQLLLTGTLPCQLLLTGSLSTFTFSTFTFLLLTPVGTLACMQMHLYHLGLTLSSLCSCATAPRAPLNGRDILAESIDDCGDIIVRLVK